MDVSVKSCGQPGDIATISWHPQARTQGFNKLNADFLVSMVSRPLFRRCNALAQIMRQCCKAHWQRILAACGVIDRHQDMDTGINFRVWFFRLGNTE